MGNGSTKGIQEFSNNDIEIVRNDKEIPQDIDLLIRWGCTSRIPAKKVLNKSESIGAVNNKFQTRKMLKAAEVSAPELFEDMDNVDFPCIVRPHNHAQGKHLFLCNNDEELKTALEKIKNLGKESYVSKYIQKDREFGIFVFDNRVWSVIEKIPKVYNGNDAVAWNVAQGTHAFQNVRWGEWNIDVCKLAIEAAKPFGIDFCRVDIIMKDNVPYVLELNSAHSLTSDYRKKGFAKCLDYFIENGRVKNDLDFEEVQTYKSIIHPGIRKNNKQKNE